MLTPMAYNTKPTNYTGHPALAMPCGKVESMPISLHLVGRFLGEALLLDMAYAYRRAVDWDTIIGVGLAHTHFTLGRDMPLHRRHMAL
jgi:Asp-tRNA(Asn)/Glu-tRNA(Gln) amidotransferase A subunit family amidase